MRTTRLVLGRMGRLLGLVVWLGALAACMAGHVGPDGKWTGVILGNGHVTVCEPEGSVTRERNPTAIQTQKDVPVGADIHDVKVVGKCVEVTGASTSTNLAIVIGVIAAAAAIAIAA